MQLTASNPQYAFAPIMGGPVQQFAGGGLAAAQQTQNKGRGDDTMLVHMTPGEVKGLQALAMAHGGSLTINPETGLPEAGFLKSLLPTLLGAGLAIATGGTSLAMSPAMIGLGVGALGTLATGSLKKGLMYGLGAWGGAGLGAGLVGAGSAGSAAATQAAEQQAIKTAGEEMAKQAASQGVAESEIAREMAAKSIAPDLSGVEAAKTAAAEKFAAQPWYQQAGQSIQAIPNQPLTTTMSQFGGGKGLAAAVAAPLSEALTPTTAAGVKPQTYIRSYDFAWNPNQQAYTPSPTPGDTSERRYFTPTYTPTGVTKAPADTISRGYTYLPVQTAAGGGLMNLAEGGPGTQASFTESPKEDQYDDERGVDAYAAGGYKRPKARALEDDGYYKFAQDRRDSSMKASIEQNFAAGGLGAAGQTLAPRFLSGGGDGMSDSIKANIDGKQEARLADGEFVVPADVVSHLGNGSSKAGAKKLYAMMDKIRKARTGKERQAPAVRAEKYMPA